jgi:predicted negative regulator of RcsB-dependent stress response
MSVYRTEEEQIEMIKKWWKRYNGIITVIASLILLAMSGYKYWNWHQDKINQQASNAYEHMMVAFSNHDNKSIRSYANQLIKDYKNTVYADAAHLTLAKLYISQAKYTQAQEQLAFITLNSKIPAFQQIAKIRSARLLIGEQSYEKALNELSTVQDNAYLSVINEIKGDIYAAKGQYSEAIAAYRLAIDEVQTKGMGNLFLEMKTNELAALTQSMSNNEGHQAA